MLKIAKASVAAGAVLIPNPKSSCSASAALLALLLFFTNQCVHRVGKGLVPHVPVSDDSFAIEQVNGRLAIDFPVRGDASRNTAIAK